MVGYLAIVLQFSSFTWRGGHSVLDVDDSDREPLKPAIEFQDVDIITALNALKPESTTLDVATFVDRMHGLYYDWQRDAPIPPSSQTKNNKFPLVVPFHNWDHGRNVWSFAQWYVSADDVDPALTADDKFLVALAALSHDVMHPGTPNIAATVEETFLPNVQTEFNNKWDLATYATKLLTDTPLDTEKMRVGLGCDFPAGACNGKTDVQVLIDRAPQEVLHSWITVEVLKAAGFQPLEQLKTIVASILMTSISAHFKVLFYRGVPDHNAIKVHVQQSANDHKLGLLLHFFDMGYVCQTGINPGTPATGQVFAARYLIESRNKPGNLADWTAVKTGQISFAKDIVGNYLSNLKDFGVIPAQKVTELERGKDSYLRNIDLILVNAKIEVNRRGQAARLALEPDEKKQIEDWTK